MAGYRMLKDEHSKSWGYQEAQEALVGFRKSHERWLKSILEELEKLIPTTMREVREMPRRRGPWAA